MVTNRDISNIYAILSSIYTGETMADIAHIISNPHHPFNTRLVSLMRSDYKAGSFFDKTNAYAKGATHGSFSDRLKNAISLGIVMYARRHDGK